MTNTIVRLAVVICALLMLVLLYQAFKPKIIDVKPVIEDSKQINNDAKQDTTKDLNDAKDNQDSLPIIDNIPVIQLHLPSKSDQPTNESSTGHKRYEQSTEPELTEFESHKLSTEQNYIWTDRESEEDYWSDAQTLGINADNPCYGIPDCKE